MARTISIAIEDWKALRAFIRDEEKVLRGSYGLPGRMATTWRDQYRRAHPEGYRKFSAALKAIARGCSAGLR